MLRVYCSDVEADIVRLIQKGSIPARIDSGSRVLYKTKANVKAQAYKQALASGQFTQNSQNHGCNT